MSEFIETNTIKDLLPKPLKQQDAYAIIRILQLSEPDSVEKLIKDRYYRVKSQSFFNFCRKNNIELKQ